MKKAGNIALLVSAAEDTVAENKKGELEKTYLEDITVFSLGGVCVGGVIVFGWFVALVVSTRWPSDWVINNWWIAVAGLALFVFSACIAATAGLGLDIHRKLTAEEEAEA